MQKLEKCSVKLWYFDKIETGRCLYGLGRIWAVLRNWVEKQASNRRVIEFEKLNAPACFNCQALAKYTLRETKTFKI